MFILKGVLRCISSRKWGWGLEKFKEHRPDLIVTDVEMPKLDGIEMSKEIRKILSDTPIIFTTAYNEMHK